MAAGIAAADVTFSGTANFGYNDTDHKTGESVGAAFSDLDLNIGFSQELNNGFTAGAAVELDYADANQGNDISASDALVSLTNGESGIYYGIMPLKMPGPLSAPWRPTPSVTQTTKW